MSQVATARFTEYFGAVHAVAVVGASPNIFCDCRVGEGRPAGAGVKLCIGREKCRTADFAGVHAGFVVVYECSGERCLRAFLAQYVVLLRGQLLFQFFFRLLCWFHICKVYYTSTNLFRVRQEDRIVPMKRETLLSCMLGLAVIGLIDAWYLADMAYTGGSLACSIAGLSGCNVVAQSEYSRFLGQPLAVYGVAFYSLFLVVAIYKFARPSLFLAKLILAFGILGALSSIYFLYIQTFLIKALCVYCIGSALVAFILCILAVYLVRLSHRKTAEKALASP